MADDTKSLIDLVRAYDFLYDPRHPDYKDSGKKADAWKKIAKKQRQSSDAVKLKWRDLKDSYVKYLKFLKGSAKSERKYKNWPWASNLRFLQDSLDSRSTASSDSTASSVPQPSTSEVIEVVDDDSMTDNSQRQPLSKKFKPKDVNLDDNSCKSLDRIDNLFLSYAETFKALPLQTQVVLKMEMAKMFGRAELSDLKHPASSGSNAHGSSSSLVKYE